MYTTFGSPAGIFSEKQQPRGWISPANCTSLFLAGQQKHKINIRFQGKNNMSSYIECTHYNMRA